MSSKIGVSAALVVAMWACGAGAQTTPQDAALAQSLFDEARKLMVAGKFDQACPKLADSQRLDPALGTLLNLAVCHEREGKTASAWAEYRDAETLARREGRSERESYARGRAAALEPKMARLVIARAPGNDARGLEVALDGVSVGDATLGSAIPIDPGDHTIEARAPGKKTWSTKLYVDAGGERASLAIPPLEDAPAPPEAAPIPAPSPEPAPVVVAPAPAPEAPPPPHRSHVASYVLGGVGLTAIAVGSVAGLRAMVEWNDRKDECAGDACTAAGLSADRSAKSWAIVADVSVGAGVAALAGAGVLWWLDARADARADQRATVRLVPIASASGGGLAAVGAW